jgi:hypothetical protein
MEVKYMVVGSFFTLVPARRACHNDELAIQFESDQIEGEDDPGEGAIARGFIGFPVVPRK